jgi:transcriptional regulator with XRE-family HTH domain
MNSIGAKLKEIRESKKLSRKDVAEKLKEKGIEISDKTLYGYEVGRTSANADMFMALCQIYEIKDVLYEFNFTGYNDDGSIQLNLPEQELVEKYRKLDKERKEFVTYILDRELEQMKRLEALIEEEKGQDVELLAAHERTDIEATEEMVQHDLNLMNDPDF